MVTLPLPEAINPAIMANRYASELVAIEAYLAAGERPIALTVLLDKYRSDQNVVKTAWHDLFHEVYGQHTQLCGVNHSIAACCLKRLNPAMAGQGLGSPLSSPDKAHRAIESLAMMSYLYKYPQLVTDEKRRALLLESAAFPMSLQDRWLAKAVHDWCKAAATLYMVDEASFTQHLAQPFEVGGTQIAQAL